MTAFIDNLLRTYYSRYKLNLLTTSQLRKLRHNYKRNSNIKLHGDKTIDFKPVVKLFFSGACTWLLSELSHDCIAFGLCDLGSGYPETGYVDLKEIVTLRDNIGMPVQRDKYFVGEKTLTEYADEARRAGKILA